MMTVKLRNILALGVAAATCGWTTAALAASGSCGLSTTGVTNQVFYDPFNPSPITGANLQLPLTRFAQGSAKTQSVSFYLTQPLNAPAFQVLLGGTNVLYSEATWGTGTAKNSLTTGGAGVGSGSADTTGTPAVVSVNFGGASMPDTITVPLTVTVPAGLDLQNGLSIKFSIVYECKGTGSLSSVNTPSLLGDAIQMPVYVLNALQAYYAGEPLDFGQLQGVNTADAQARAPVAGHLHVASSGPYEVSLASSDPTNPFRMTYSGGSRTTIGQYIPYKVALLGQSVDNATPFTTVGCPRAGVTGGQDIAISATLEDGGVGKTPAAYSDTLTVTFTPKNFPSSTQASCS
jgi:hypothetical protein